MRDSVTFEPLNFSLQGMFFCPVAAAMQITYFNSFSQPLGCIYLFTFCLLQ